MGYFYHNELYDNQGKRKRIWRGKRKRQRGENEREGENEEESKGIGEVAA